MDEQVFTSGQVIDAENSVIGQILAPENDNAGLSPLHIDVIEGDISRASTRRQQGHRTDAKRSRRRRAKRRTGGWQATAYISHELRRETRTKARLLAREGYPLTILATVRGLPGQTDADAKHHVALQLARLGQKLERAGHGYIGFVTYEKFNGLLHGHAPLHVLPDCLPMVRAWADRFDPGQIDPDKIVESVERHARPFVYTDIMYVLKQHLWCGRECEKKMGFYQKGEPFKGNRIGWTKTAKAIIKRAEARDADAHARALQARERVYLFDENGQGNLFGNLPEYPTPETRRRAPQRRERLPPPTLMLRLFALVTDNTDVIAAMRALGPTHQAIADRLGISRQQVTNILNGQFRPSRAVVKQVLRLAKAA